MKFSRILLPVDFTDASREALRYARLVAATFGSELHLLHVVPDARREPWAGEVIGLDLDALTEEWVRDAGIRLQGIVRGLKSTHPVRTSVRLGTAPEQIVAYAAEQQIDLVVIGAHRDRKAQDWLRGSVAERVVRRAACAVLTVPGGAAAEPSADESASQPEEAGAAPAIRTILIPVDFSTAADVALRGGLELARQFGARVHVLYVYDPPWAKNLAYVPPPAHLTEELRCRAEQRLAREVAAHHEPSLEVCADVRVGDPYAEILLYAIDARADLIVMGTHSRHSIGRLLLGNVAQKVLRHAPCPILAVHEERADQKPVNQGATTELLVL
jgi:nucleotide-binding universal stress UspA family protein